MSMIERVAATLAIHNGYIRNPDNFKYLADPFRNKMIIQAKAAIEAMREPTDVQRNNYFILSQCTETMNDAHWERAVDAALKE